VRAKEKESKEARVREKERARDSGRERDKEEGGGEKELLRGRESGSP